MSWIEDRGDTIVFHRYLPYPTKEIAMSKRIAAQFTVWFREKYREQARLNDVQYAARNLRKQGVPVEYAVAILAGR